MQDQWNAYQWNTLDSTQTISAVNSGSYSVLVENINGCSNSDTIVINLTPEIIPTLISTDALCFGSSTGSVQLGISGGTSPYSAIWNTGLYSFYLDTIPAGNYSVTISDNNGCSVTDSVLVNEPSQMIDSIQLGNTLCYGDSSGWIDLSVWGGTTPYSFVWTDGSINEDLSNIPAGNYIVTITDANGCNLIDSAEIAQPTQISLVANITHNLCYGDSAGNIGLNILGGTLPYSVAWNSQQDSIYIEGLAAQEYLVTVVDANTCELIDTFIIEQPDSIQLSFTSNNVQCPTDSTGAIDMSIVGGNPPFEILWSTGDSIEDILGYPAGNYSVTVIDSTGCQRVDTAYISAPNYYATFAVTNVNCPGNANGSIDMTVMGGVSPFTYQWSTGAQIGPSSEDIYMQSGGTYFVTVTDSTGCNLIEQVDIFEPDSIIMQFDIIDVSCFGSCDASIDLTVTGGTTPYTYLWGGFGTTEDISNLCSGNYICFVMDANFCSAFESAYVGSPLPIIGTALPTDLSCFGANDGSINLVTAIGGTGPLSIEWSTNDTVPFLDSLSAGYYSLSITDSTSCQVTFGYQVSEPDSLSILFNATNVACYGESNGWIDMTPAGGTPPYQIEWSNNQITEDIYGLSTGFYAVTLTDANNCSKADSVFIHEPEFPLNITWEITNVTCNGGQDGAIDITVTGGTSPYSYEWPTVGAFTEDLTGLESDFYILFVLDSMGCEAETELYVDEPNQPVSINLTVGDISCYGGSDGFLVANTYGGTPPYTYNWFTYGTNDSISGLSNGSYYVTVTDTLGCEASEVYGLVQPDPLTLSFAMSNVNCHDGTDGEIDLTVIGGTGPFTFLWNNNDTTEDLSGQQAGNFAVTVTDNNGCTTNDITSLSQPLMPLNGFLQPTSVNCYGGNDGQITTSVNGGTSPYSYLWSGNGATSQNLTGITAGFYSLSITDDNGCEFIAHASVNQPASALQASVISNHITCFGYNNGEIFINASGGTSPYQYQWSSSDTTSSANNLSAGNYLITIIDDNGCDETVSTEIIEPDKILANYLIDDVLCYGDSTGNIYLSVSGGSYPYSYEWSNAHINEDNLEVPAGWYYVTIQDNQNCEVVDSAYVGQPLSPIQLDIVGINVNCQDPNSGAAQSNPTGGTHPYSYFWSTGATTQSIDSLSNGTYYLTVNDDNGCMQTDTVEITLPVYIAANISVVTNFNGYDVSCFGADDGIVQMNITSGTSPYQVQWSNGASTEYIDNIAAGNYIVQISDNAGCTYRDSLTITEPSELQIAPFSAAPNCPDVYDGSIQLNVTGGIAPYDYIWDNNEITEELFELSSGVYGVTITDANNCSLTYQESLDFVYDECLFIPNAITPNADGYNDVWQIRGIELYPEAYIEIYNRWGQVMFKSDRGYTHKWDGTYEGKALPMDTYYYMIQLKKGSEPLIGQITVVR